MSMVYHVWMRDDDLLYRWREQWPACSPIADELKTAYPDRWVRFHGLPNSKRYPSTDDEYAAILDRNNTILDILFKNKPIYVITPDWSSSPEATERLSDQIILHPGAQHWTTICTDPDPENPSYIHLYVSEMPWGRGCIDKLLRAVADDAISGTMITDTSFQRIHHPYDGGMDVILAARSERDQLRSRYTDWTSPHPRGL